MLAHAVIPYHLGQPTLRDAPVEAPSGNRAEPRSSQEFALQLRGPVQRARRCGEAQYPCGYVCDCNIARAIQPGEDPWYRSRTQVEHRLDTVGEAFTPIATRCTCTTISLPLPLEW